MNMKNVTTSTRSGAGLAVRDGNALSRLAILGIALLAAFATALVISLPAYANIQLDSPIQVSDDTTHFSVNKLDADTQEYVQGASMAIINEATGEIVDQWVTGKATHSTDKALDVNVVYILREVEAPEGYEKVDDVRFEVNETEGTGITILSQGNDSELKESYVVNLYDKQKVVENEIVVTETKPTPTPTTSTSKAPAPKTGDETPMTTVALLVGAGILAIVLLQLPKRRMKDEQ
jgi:hypothetical protein